MQLSLAQFVASLAQLTEEELREQPGRQLAQTFADMDPVKEEDIAALTF